MTDTAIFSKNINLNDREKNIIPLAVYLFHHVVAQNMMKMILDGGTYVLL